MLSLFCYNLFFEKSAGLHWNRLQKTFTQKCFVPSMIESGQVAKWPILEKKQTVSTVYYNMHMKYKGKRDYKIWSVCLENVALNKAAWQKNPYLNDEFNASLAVDGKKTNLSIWECVVSSYDRTAEWRVDLNGVLSIHHILIQYAKNKPVWGMFFHIFWKNMYHFSVIY